MPSPLHGNKLHLPVVCSVLASLMIRPSLPPSTELTDAVTTALKKNGGWDPNETLTRTQKTF